MESQYYEHEPCVRAERASGLWPEIQIEHKSCFRIKTLWTVRLMPIFSSNLQNIVKVDMLSDKNRGEMLS